MILPLSFLFPSYLISAQTEDKCIYVYPGVYIGVTFAVRNLIAVA